MAILLNLVKNGVILSLTKLINQFYMLAYTRHTIMTLVYVYTFWRLGNPIGTF